MHLKNTVLSFLFSILMKNSRINWSSLFYSFCWSYYLLILNFKKRLKTSVKYIACDDCPMSKFLVYRIRVEYFRQNKARIETVYHSIFNTRNIIDFSFLPKFDWSPARSPSITMEEVQRRTFYCHPSPLPEQPQSPASHRTFDKENLVFDTSDRDHRLENTISNIWPGR